MAIDLELFSSKLERYRKQFFVTVNDVHSATGIPIDRLLACEAGKTEPTGDEVLILADYFKCDYRFFISNERLAPFEQTEELFRRWGDQLSREDRWVIQEFLFLCECEFDLMRELGKAHKETPRLEKKGTYFKGQGIDAAMKLRELLGYQLVALPEDVFADFRRIGAHVFRRALDNSGISGIYVKHPVAGACILVNYSEDVFRQRFTAAHEMAHAVLDYEEDFVVSFSWDKNELVEIRADSFAGTFLAPPDFLKLIPKGSGWDEEKVLEWSRKLKVNPPTLAIGLRNAGLIDKDRSKQLGKLKLPSSSKNDPELSPSLAPGTLARREEMLKRGLSTSYVDLCLEAYHLGLVSAGRLAEMLLTTQSELISLVRTFGRSLSYGD